MKLREKDLKRILCTQCLTLLIRERVKNGLANARAKGKLIGRKKMRDSDLIRKLLRTGMTYRNVALIARCSHGSVHQEKLAMKKDEAAAQLKAQLEAEKVAKEKAEMEKESHVLPDIEKLISEAKNEKT